MWWKMLWNCLKLKSYLLYGLWQTLFIQWKNFIHEVKKLTLICKATCNYAKVQFFCYISQSFFIKLKVFIWPCFKNKISFSTHSLKYGTGQSSFWPCSIELEFISVIYRPKQFLKVPERCATPCNFIFLHFSAMKLKLCSLLIRIEYSNL